MCTTADSVQEIATDTGVARGSLYKWKNQLLQKGEHHSMVKKLNNLFVDKEELLSEQEKLQ
jgi:transposase-like protein